ILPSLSGNINSGRSSLHLSNLVHLSSEATVVGGIDERFRPILRTPNLAIDGPVTLTRQLRAVSFFAPSRPVFHNPINQGTFKTYVVASFLAFNPFVPKDFSAFG